VLLELGEPDGRGSDDQWFTYGSAVRRGGLRWALVAASYGGAGAVGSIDSWDTSRRLTIRFDDHGVISALDAGQRKCTEWDDHNDCLSAKGTDITEADERRIEEAFLAAFGATLQPLYKSYIVERAIGPSCKFTGLHGLESGDSLRVMEKGVLWRRKDYTTGRAGSHWESLRFEEIKEVGPAERHGFVSFLKIILQDDSCVFVHVRSDALRSQILNAMRGA
jgi:hypothetical protein